MCKCLIGLGLCVGLGGQGRPARRQGSPPLARPRFDVVSVRPCQGSDAAKVRSGRSVRYSPNRLSIECWGLGSLIRWAYLGFPDGAPWSTSGPPAAFMRVMDQPTKGGPAWIESARYTIVATTTATPAPTEAMMRGPMMQTLLESRFKLKVHRQAQGEITYVLTAPDPRLQPTPAGECAAVDPDQPAGAPRPQAKPACGFFRAGGGDGGLDTSGATMAGLCLQLSAWLGHDVIDKTGLRGSFDLHLSLSPAAAGFPGYSEPAGAVATAAPVASAPAITSALKKLGLRLQRTKASGEILVIDHVARPAPN